MNENLISEEIKGETLVLAFSHKRIDMSMLLRFQKQFENINRSYKSLVLDCTAVSYIDSTVIGFFVSVYKQVHASGSSLALVTKTQRVLELFKLTKIDRLIPVHENLDQVINTTTA